MTPELSAHLSEEAANDVLIGMASPESEAHLAVCSICRGQLEDFRSEMRLFNEASIKWSEARPVAARRATPRQKLRGAILLPAGLALAAALLLAIGLSVWSRDHRSAPNYAAAPSSLPGDSEAQIAQDNDLLRSVDAALSENEASPVSEYHLSDAPHSRLKARPELRNP